MAWGARLGSARAAGAASDPASREGVKTARLAGDNARPWLYAFWLDGNATKEGIAADLEAMKAAGIGGFLFFDGSLGMPPGACRFMSGPWQEQFRYMVAEAGRLGLQIDLNDGPGWAGSPGPWITPELASQVIVYSHTVLEGPSQFRGTLRKPDGIRHQQYGGMLSTPDGIGSEYYRDIVTLAFELPGEMPDYRIKWFDSAKSFAGGMDFEGVTPWPRFIAARTDWPEIPASQRLASRTMQDLSEHLHGDTVQWSVPAGRWLVLRFGHTVANGAARAAQRDGMGLECDKMSKAALDAQFAAYVGKLADAPASQERRVIVATHVDSWEAGSGNWTAGFGEEFKLRRGYDPLSYLPTLAGFVVDSLKVSERFLWDWRETVAELMLENYAQHMAGLARAHGLRFSLEGYDGTCDDLRYSGRADEPMGEFWQSCSCGLPMGDTCETAASAAHVYGKPIVGAESFTAERGAYLEHPATLKPLADWALCVGINRLALSEWVFQPWLGIAPGLTFADLGTPFERTLTWWPKSRSWHDYLARCQEVLREGHFVADVCFVTPEGAPYRFTAPVPATVRGIVPCRPGYNFDGCPAELVMEQMDVEGGEVTLPSGMRYRLLVLPTYDALQQPVIRLLDIADHAYKATPMPKVSTMTPALLRRVKVLVERGATVLGWRPLESPSLSGYPQCDTEVARLADELWGKGAGYDGSGARQVGKGRVCWGQTPEEIFAKRGLPPDFACSPNLEGVLNYTHRRREDGTDVYFIVNKSDTPIEGAVSLRVQGKRPEVLWPQTGASAPLPFFSPGRGVTDIPLALEANESIFLLLEPGTGPDPVVAVLRDGQELWPRKTFMLPPVDPRDDSFIMANWVEPAWDIWGPIPLPVEIEGRLRYETTLELVGRGMSNIFTAPGQGRAGFSIGSNGIVVFRYAEDGRVEPLLVHEMQTSRQTHVHVGVVYQDRVPRLFIDGVLVKTGPRASSPLRGRSGWEDRRPFAGQLAAFQQFEDMLAAAGYRERRAGSSRMPALDYLRGLIWESGSYVLKTASGSTRDVRVELPSPTALDGPWSVEFDVDWGGPGTVQFERLDDWSRREEPGIRYYSGTARYRKRFAFDRHMARGMRVHLDLGRVADLAEVVLNGVELGVLWHPPYRLDVTEHLRAENQLEVRVTNRWVNRLIGDQQLADDGRYNAAGALETWPDWLLAGKRSPTGRYTFTTRRMWQKGDPLVTSGLLGPVRLRWARSLGGAVNTDGQV